MATFIEKFDELLNAVIQEKAQLAVAAEIEKIMVKTTNYISKEETLSKLQISSSTLWRWEKKGKLKPIRVGRKIKYDLAQVLALYNGQF